MDDTLLLRQFAADRSDAAFARIVDRYGGLIYAAAKRHVGQTQLAEDVTQATFWTLACKADSIPPERSLAAWLLTTTRFIALNARRKQARIAKHEVAVSLHTGGTVDLSIWGPLLDEGLQRLSPADRDVLVWRFFESHPLAEVGRRANVSEEAARKRVTRALSRLRE
ncbi:MAG TPA: sigma-70 family RNA polymerase sigma factor, partial [Tepidisphaeraceae bacterium]